MGAMLVMGRLLLLVVVDDLDVLGPGVGPDETDAPLLVDPDAVLPGAARLEAVRPSTGISESPLTFYDHAADGSLDADAKHRMSPCP